MIEAIEDEDLFEYDFDVCTRLNLFTEFPGAFHRCYCCTNLVSTELIALKPCGHFMCRPCLLIQMDLCTKQNLDATNLAGTKDPSLCDVCKQSCDPVYWNLNEIMKNWNPDGELQAKCGGRDVKLSYGPSKFTWE